MRLLADTCVLIDYLLCREGFVDEMRDLFVMAAFGDAEIWASAKSFTDVFYVARKAVGSMRAQASMEALLERLRVCSIDGDDVSRALAARWPDFEDCVVAQAAEKVKADYIITRNAPDFGCARIPALSARALLDKVSAETGRHYTSIDF